MSRRYGYRDARGRKKNEGQGYICFGEWEKLRKAKVSANTWALYVYLVVRVSNRTKGREWWLGLADLNSELKLPKSSAYEALSNLLNLELALKTTDENGNTIIQLVY